MFLPDSRPKRRLLRQIQRLLRGLRADQRVLEAVAFDGPLTPARRGELLEQRPEVPVARFDLAVLVETTSPATAAELEAEPLWGELAGSRLHGVEVRAMNTSAATQVRSGTPPRGEVVEWRRRLARRTTGSTRSPATAKSTSPDTVSRQAPMCLGRGGGGPVSMRTTVRRGRGCG
jgi:hypothetical protein